MLKPQSPYDPNSSCCGIRILPPPGYVTTPTVPGWPQPGGSGTPVYLTYGFINYTADLTVELQRAIIENALALWAAVVPLHFAETADGGLPFDHPAATVPDIRIGWFSGDHDDDHPFDGAGNVLAHAYFPPVNGVTAAGDTHFDDAESWSDGGTGSWPSPTSYDLNEVAAHELGHALGLGHEPEVAALMNPWYKGPRDPPLGWTGSLYPDDIDGIRAVYGAGVGSVTPLGGATEPPVPTTTFVPRTTVPPVTTVPPTTQPPVTTSPPVTTMPPTTVPAEVTTPPTAPPPPATTVPAPTTTGAPRMPHPYFPGFQVSGTGLAGYLDDHLAGQEGLPPGSRVEHLVQVMAIFLDTPEGRYEDVGTVLLPSAPQYPLRWQGEGWGA